MNGINEPTELYKLDTVTGDKVDVFASFLEKCGVHTSDKEFGVSMEDYYGRSFLFASDRTQMQQIS